MELTLTSTQVTTDPHRFGMFWLEGKKSYSISRMDIVSVASRLGFCLFRGELFKISGIIISQSNEREFQDALINYVEDVGQVNYPEIVNTLEAFLQKNGKYTISRLPIIQSYSFLNDDKDNCYKFFKNGYIHITAEKVTALKYSNFPKDKYILHSKIQNRDYAINKNGKYLEFLKNATAWNEYENNIKSIIGYLAHEYKDETTGFIIVLTEQCPDPKDGGGSGKNLFCNLLSHTTTYCSKNGKQIKFDEKFFQSWSGQRIMGISDTPKNFDFEFLKEPSTGTFIQKKLFKDEVEIPVSEGPKFIVQTNYSYEISDGGLRRRIMPIEFSDFFTKAGGVDVYFKCHFPNGWTESDWNNYDTIIIESVKIWLKSNKKIQSASLTETGWEKQFEHTYSRNMAEFIREYFEKWIFNKEVPSEDIRAYLGQFYIDNDIPIKFHFSTQRVASGIKEWARHKGWNCQNNVQVDFLGTNKKCYIFSKTS